MVSMCDRRLGRAVRHLRRLFLQPGVMNLLTTQVPIPPQKGEAAQIDASGREEEHRFDFRQRKPRKVHQWTYLPRNTSVLHRPQASRTIRLFPNPNKRRRAQRLRNPRALPAGRRVSSSSGATQAAAVLYIYDALYKQDTIQHVLVRHEQAAVHAADGYARATGEVGVALVTSPDRVSRTRSPVSRRRTWTRYRWWSSPARCLHAAIGLDAFQECDTVGITRPDRQAQLPGQGCPRSGA